MVFKIGQLLEEGKFNWKGLKNILHDHEARLDRLEESVGVIEKETIVYSFTSYDSLTKDTEWGTGTCELTGVESNGYKQVIVKTNTVESFVGQKFYIISSAKTDGTVYELYTDAGTTSADIFVTISK